MNVSRLLYQRWRPLWILVLALFLLFPPVASGASGPTAGAASSPDPASLSTEINNIINGGRAESAFWGIQIRDINTGEVLYEMNEDRSFLPASNQKLFTSATALDALGGDYRYQTTLYFDGEVDGSVLRGDLVIKGTGDPSFGSAEMDGGDPLRRWAQALSEMGVTRVEGRLIGDDDVFGNRFYPEGWDVDYVTTQSSRLMGVSANGLAYHDNLIRVSIRAGRAGEEPTIRTNPADYLGVVNRATTSARRRGRSLDIERPFGTNQILLTGSVPAGYRGTLFMPMTNPTTFTLHSFRADLREAGIGVQDLKTIDIDDLDEGPETSEMEPLFVHFSPPLKEILKVVDKESNNFYADQVFRSFSESGTANASENRVKTLLERAGASTDNISIRDGSGLSRKDLITPAVMTKMLDYMASHPEGDAFRAALAEGGEAESTLQYRLRGQPVWAKTGSLEFARALSGYVRLAGGREVAFCFFANNYAGPSYRVTQAFDRIIRTMTS